jgi:hypothetical protein
MDDASASPLSFLLFGGLLNALAWVMLTNAQTSGESFFGFAALWFGAVLTVAGAVRLGLPARSRGDRVSGPGERRTPW